MTPQALAGPREYYLVRADYHREAMPRRRQGVERDTDRLTRGRQLQEREGHSLTDGLPREVKRLVEEQAALRRVATLVAEEASATELFSAVAHEVGTLFATDLAAMARFEEDAFKCVV